jgi:hypothetical protein
MMFVGEQTNGNLSQLASDYIRSLNLSNTPESAASLWFHILAIGYSPAYLEENADGIQQNWPRIPLPSSFEQFEASASLGQRVADLLNTESPVTGVTAGALRPELRSVAGLNRMDGKPLHTDEDLQLTAGWGHATKEGAVMPGRGKLVSRERTTKELSNKWAGGAGHSAGRGLEASRQHGDGRVSERFVRLDECAGDGLGNLHRRLSSNEEVAQLPGVQLSEASPDFGRGRRGAGDGKAALTALCLLQPELDANYLKVKSVTGQV